MKDTNSQDSLELKLVHSTFDWSFRAFCISLVSKLTLVENCSIVKGFPQGSYFKASYFENSRTNGKIGYKICRSVALETYNMVLFCLNYPFFTTIYNINDVLCQHSHMYILFMKALYVSEKSQPKRR